MRAFLLVTGAALLAGCMTLGGGTTATYSISPAQFQQAKDVLGIPQELCPADQTATAVAVRLRTGGGTVTVTCHPRGAVP